MNMNRTKQRVILWAPRLLGVLYAAFISVFALDVFAEGRPIGETLVALAMHLIPTALVLLILAAAWKWPWIGTAGYASLAAVYSVWAWRHPLWIALIGGPLLLIAALFLASHIMLRRARPAPASGPGAGPPAQ